MSSYSRLSRAVIGLGFGDEGKGKKVHKITEKWPESVVVRYSGGQQAGHTVYFNKTTGHVFANFGAGTFNGVPTYWSRFCSFDPVGVMRELEVLQSLNLNPKLYVDRRCPITTPFEKAYNQNTFDYLNNGTCGVGVGQTFEREENYYHLQIRDYQFPKVSAMKLEGIAGWYQKLEHQVARVANQQINEFQEAMARVIESDNIEFVDGLDDLPPELCAHMIVFEGSQGILLDQHMGFFPHVTRSNVGSKNILELCKDFNIEPPVLELMTRAYQTRHGNGPMSNEGRPVELENTEWETNKANRYQGEFRTAILDLDMIEYALDVDDYFRKAEHAYINVTCLDQLKEFKLTSRGETKVFNDAESFVNFITEVTKIKAQPETGPF